MMTQNTTQREELIKTVIEIAIKLGAISLILYISFLIVQPFISLVLWSVILAVTLFPVVETLAQKFQVSRKKMVISLAIVFNLALVVPTYLVSDKAIDSVKQLSSVAQQGKIVIPKPPLHVKEWPFVGEGVYDAWDEASINLTSTLKTFEPQIKQLAGKMVKVLGEALRVILLSVVSVVIAVYLIIKAEPYSDFYRKVSVRLIGEKGEEWAKLTALTIRSVATGVIGVAVIQAFFALVGFIVMKVHFSVVLALGVMFLTIVQLPAFIIIGPVIAIVLSQDSSSSTIIFSIYMLLVSGMDGVLKPLLMGRGVNIPMLVILIGAIGGMMLMGMIGLFVGAVVFALAYKLFMLWLSEKM